MAKHGQNGGHHRPVRLPHHSRRSKWLRAIRSGLSDADASKISGIPISTMAFWRQKARNQERAADSKGFAKVRTFLEEVDAAEAEGRLEIVDRITNAALAGEWRADLALLRQSPKHRAAGWGDSQQIELSGRLEHDVDLPTDAEVIEWARELLEGDEDAAPDG